MPRFVMAAVLAAFSFLCAALVPPLSFAQESEPVQRGPREMGAEYLYRMFGESPILIAALPDGRYFEVYAHPPSGSWTMFMILPGGIACPVASGEGWEAMKPRQPGEKGA